MKPLDIITVKVNSKREGSELQLAGSFYVIVAMVKEDQLIFI